MLEFTSVISRFDLAPLSPYNRQSSEMHRPKLVKPFGAIYSRPLANAKRWCMPTYQATSRKMSPQRSEHRRAMFGRCLADDVLLPGVE
ncbi:hypothetical protein AVEN_227329-1 [Araneus ventricosus]|uniref:Uncharacterized protein n=1 Tax=Araneus ventricosus TaxID=182803 RepID=A0A4Y2GVR1_ARAVE|nr:hypothetical protein AVEN_227329-1 [Araneus ventricosus]